VTICTAPEGRGDRDDAFTGNLGGRWLSDDPAMMPSVSGHRVRSRLEDRTGCAAFRRRIAAWLLWSPAAGMALVFAMTFASSAAELRPWTGGPRAGFALESLNGGRVEPAMFRNRVVLLHFFATWCEPCRAEMISLRHLSARHAGRPLSVLAVDVAEVRPRVERFFAADPVPFPILLDADRAVAKAWRIEALPTTVVLDRQSNPVLISEGDLDWSRADVEAALTAVLNEPTD
jgi:thiol-disulfide isomerase/thioredoxin